MDAAQTGSLASRGAAAEVTLDVVLVGVWRLAAVALAADLAAQAFAADLAAEVTLDVVLVGALLHAAETFMGSHLTRHIVSSFPCRLVGAQAMDAS
jgi:hypothetical protein